MKLNTYLLRTMLLGISLTFLCLCQIQSAPAPDLKKEWFSHRTWRYTLGDTPWETRFDDKESWRLYDCRNMDNVIDAGTYHIGFRTLRLTSRKGYVEVFRFQRVSSTELRGEWYYGKFEDHKLPVVLKRQP